MEKCAVPVVVLGERAILSPKPHVHTTYHTSIQKNLAQQMHLIVITLYPATASV